MRLLTLVHLMLILCLSANGQDGTIWLSGKQLENTGYFKNHGLKKTRVEIGLAIENNDRILQERILKLHNPHINNVYLTTLKNDTLYKTGDHRPFRSRPEYFWDFVLPIQTLGYSVDSFKLILDNSGEPLLYNLELFSKNEFQRIRSNENFLFGAVLSFSILFIGIFLLLGYFKKDIPNLIFAFFVISSTLWLFNINGVLYQMIWPNNTFIQHTSRAIFSSLTIGSLVWYFLSYYEKYINSYARYVFTSFIIFIFLRALIVIAMPGLYDDAESKKIPLFITTFILLAGSLCFVVYLIWLFSIKEVLVHTISIAVYFLFIIKEILKLIGIDLSPFPGHDDYLSSIVHFVILTMFSIGNIQEYRLNKKKRLYERIAESDLRKRIMSEKILEAQENERSAIAKNIHDQVGGMLAAMKIKLQTMKLKYEGGKDENELISLLDNCNDELYKIVDELTTPEFSQRDLSEILQDRINLISMATGVRIHYNPSILEIGNNVAIKIYRVICELLTNSIKHAACSDIELDISRSDGFIFLNYADNGVGFVENVHEKGRGLENIKRRIEFLQGKLQLYSRRGETRYTITIPTNEHDKQQIDLYL